MVKFSLLSSTACMVNRITYSLVYKDYVMPISNPIPLKTVAKVNKTKTSDKKNVSKWRNSGWNRDGLAIFFSVSYLLVS